MSWGHYAAAKQRNLDGELRPSFLSSAHGFNSKEQPMDVETEAYVGIAGPVAGTVAAMACYYAAEYTQSQLLLALAYAGFMINLFNLIPLSPWTADGSPPLSHPRSGGWACRS